MLNPSERMNIAAVTELADQRGLQGLDREFLLNWAVTAEANWRWGEKELQELFTETGIELIVTTLKVGTGLARFAKGMVA